jgi:hypothetical protein
VWGWAKTRQRNDHNRTGAKVENFCRPFMRWGVFAPFLGTEVMG